MAVQNAAVFGILQDTSQADKTVSRLTSAGFSSSDVSVLSLIVSGLLARMGVPEYQAMRYQERVKDGGILLVVRCANSLEIERAHTIMTENGADDIVSTGEPVSSAPGIHGR